MSDRERIEADLGEAQAAIGAARMLLDEGRVVDLAGLEQRVSEICDTIAAMPANDRLDLKSLLVSLIDDLNALARSLTEQYEKMGGALKGVTDRHRAASAYGGAAKPGGPARKK